jgi:hypothetical protein
MHLLRLHKIISIAIIIILTLSQAAASYALYSPTLNNEVVTIKQHLQTSKKVNGYGTWQQLYDKDQLTPNEGLNNLFVTSLKEILIQSLTNSFTDGLSLLFGRWIGSGVSISNCLRDDVWELQALQDQVLNEVMKASLLSDSANSGILWVDYQHLRDRIEGGNDNVKYLKKDFKDTKEWFPNSQNFYVDCPYGEFTKAWSDLQRSFNSFNSLRTGPAVGSLGSFGSMAEIAKKRSIARANQYIKANQISLTIGGKDGASPRDITTGAGLSGLAATLKTELDYASSFSDLIFSSEWKKNLPSGLPNISDYVVAYQQAYKAKDLATTQMESAIKFNLSLQDVSEQGLISVDSILSNTNNTIQNAYQTKVEPETLESFCERLLSLCKKQCSNRNACSNLNCKK